MKKKSLKEVNPELAKQWHPTKNGNLTPDHVTLGSGKKVWWVCNNKHEWETAIYNRNKGNGCPYCSGHRVSPDKSLFIINSKLSKSWHPTKNENMTPEDVLPNSNKSVWWICNKDHEWKATIASRNGGDNCPFCSGHRVTPENCLATINPKLSEQWHLIKNGNFTPVQVTPNSHKKVWWQCIKGHVWEAIIASRNRGNGCPYCAGVKVCIDNCLATLNPSLVKEWHPTKNGKLTSKDVTPGSENIVWWQCSKDHEWQTSINNRNKGDGCPFCSGKKVNEENCLTTVNSSLAKEWHPTKNKELTPLDVTISSNKKVWWKCINDHEWLTTVNHRTSGNNCPFCSGRYATRENCLAVKNPELASEWHPTKNGELSPRDITVSSNKKVWWICKRGHEWEVAPNHRTRGSGCPYCVSSTSEIEIYIYSEIKYFFKNAIHRHKIDGIECDIYIPELKLAIEYDGGYWHKDSIQRDLRKNNKLEKLDISILRIRGKGLKKISSTDIHYNFGKGKKTDLLKDISLFLIKQNNILSQKVILLQKYIDNPKQINIAFYKKYIDRLPFPFEGQSLADQLPHLVSEWHPTKNGNLAPDQVTSSSNKKVWWECKFGHEWETTVAHRSGGTNCPFCSGRYATKENCLAIKNPELSNLWHPMKNGKLTPKDVTSGSNKKVWWQCEKGHEWEARVADRNKGDGCPYCSGKKVCLENCLAVLNPKLSKEWHPIKNIDLTPYQVTPGSGKKVWWICSERHDYQAQIANRNNGTGCPKCSINREIKVPINRSLQIINPELSKEWHPTKNGDLSAVKVTPGSNKKVWWQCEKKHDWEAQIAKRTKGTGCPYCSGKKICYDNCLATINPDLAKEWHLTKNGKLNPDMVTPGSGKKIWWKCEKGHEWETAICNRNKGTGCPYCVGQKVSIDNCLATINPEISKQWHPTKNGDLKPTDFTFSSGKYIWWVCNNEHVWQASITNRNKGRGCPNCFNLKRGVIK